MTTEPRWRCVPETATEEMELYAELFCRVGADNPLKGYVSPRRRARESYRAHLSHAPRPPAGLYRIDEHGYAVPVEADVVIERIANRLHDHEGEPWTWPDHEDDDGYRGEQSYVRITPADIRRRYRDRARATLAALHSAPAEGAADGPQAASTTEGEGSEKVGPRGHGVVRAPRADRGGEP